MRSESRQAVRAVFLAAIMVTSVFAAGVAFSGSAAAGHGGGDTIVVDDDFSTTNSTHKNTIQAAINSADPGDTIEVSSGTYEESVTITTSGLTLRGVGNPTIVGNGENAGSQPHAAIHIDDGSGPVRNVTIEGFTVENPNGKYGIFAGTGSTNKEPDGIGGLVIRNNVVRNISTNSTGRSLTGGPAGIGIRADYGTNGYPGIEISDNEISNVQGSAGAEPIGITLKSFTGKAGFGFNSTGASVTDAESPPATHTDIVNNEISNIASVDGGYATKGISVSGEFQDVDVINNSITGIESPGGTANAITFTENSGSYSGNQYDIDGDGNGERIGPRNFTIAGNDVDGINASSPTALFIGGYEDLGDAHSVSNNNFRDGTVNRYAGKQPGYQIGDGDTLNAEENYWGAASGPNGAISPPSNTDNPKTLPDGDGIVVFTNGADGDGNPQTGLVDVTPWLDAPAPGGNATAPVTNVETGELYPTIQAGVDDASPGELVSVDAGTYNESVEISTRNVTLVGPNAGTPGYNDSRSSEAVIQQGVVISADSVTLDGFEVTNDGGNGIRVANAPSNVVIVNNRVVGVTGGMAGSSKAFANGINLQFTDAFNKTSRGIVIANNEIHNITTGDVDAHSNDVIGIQLLPRGNDVVGLSITDNVISDIEAGDASSNGRSEARGVSVDTQFVDQPNGDNRGNFGQAKGLTIEGNVIRGLTSEYSRAITLFEDKGGSASNPGTPIGPVNFTIRRNTIDNITSVDPAGRVDAPPTALFVGGYANLGADHEVTQNNIREGVISRFLYGQVEPPEKADPLAAPLNWWGENSTPRVGGIAIYDPVLTAPTGQVADDTRDIRNYGSYLELETEGEPAVIGFPAPPAEPLGELISNETLQLGGDGEGAQIFLYDNEEQSFEEVDGSFVPEAGDVIVITTGGDPISGEFIVPVDTTVDGQAATPSDVQINEGWNLVATGAAESLESPTATSDIVDAGQFQTQPVQPGAPNVPVGAYEGTWLFAEDDGQLTTGYVEGQSPPEYFNRVLIPEDDENSSS